VIRYLLLLLVVLAGFDIYATDASLKKAELIDMSTRIIISSATAHKRTIIYSTSNIRNTDLYIFNHKNKEVWEIKDGRLPSRDLPVLFSLDDGFATVDYIRLSVVYLNIDGSFKGSDNLSEFEGAISNFKTVKLAPYKVNQGLFTLLDLDNNYRSGVFR